MDAKSLELGRAARDAVMTYETMNNMYLHGKCTLDAVMEAKATKERLDRAFRNHAKRVIYSKK